MSLYSEYNNLGGSASALQSTNHEISLAADRSDDHKEFARSKYAQKTHSNQEYKMKDKQSFEVRYKGLVDHLAHLRANKKDTKVAVKALETLKRKGKKLKKIAFAHSGTFIDDVQSAGSALLDGLQAIIRYLQTIREVVGETVLALMLDLFTTLYNVYKCPEWDTMLVNFTSFFSRHFPEKYADYALVWLRTAFEVAFTQDTSCSWRELIEKFFTNSSDLLNDALWENLSTFFVKIASLYACMSDVVSFETLDIALIVKNFHIFKQQIPEVKDLIEMAFLAYEFVLGNWERVCSGDWSVILLGKDETQEFEVEVRVLEQAFPFVIAGKEIVLKDKFHMTPKLYSNRLGAAIKKAKSLISRCTSVQQRMSVSTFIKTLTEKQSQLFAAASDAPRKLEAYAVKFSGPSGTGKSTLLDICSRILLRAYQHDPTERGQVVFTNISEKFESTILPSHKIICADDVANNANEEPDYDRILNYVNTVPRPLIKADTKEKGIYYPCNDVFLATTNDETLRATKCSSCPESILRRFALDVKVEIRPEFRNSYGGLMLCDEPRYDVYMLTLKRFSHIEYDEKHRPTVKWDIIPREVWNKYGDESHDFAAMCAFLAVDVQRHITAQKRKFESQKKLDDCSFCPLCGIPEIVCGCIPCTISDAVSDADLDILEVPELERESIPLIDTSFERPVSSIDPHGDIVPSEEIAEQAIAMYGNFWSTLETAALWDYRLMISGCVRTSMRLCRKGSWYVKMYKYRKTFLYYAGIFFFSMFLPLFVPTWLAVCNLLLVSFCATRLYYQIVAEIDAELTRRVDRLSSLCQDVREHLRSNMVKYFGIGVSLLAIYKGYTIVRPFLFSQDKSTYFEKATDLFSNILQDPKSPKHLYEVQDERDYKEGYSRMTPRETRVSKTSTSEDLQLAVAKALRVVVVKSKGQIYGTVNGILVASNVILVPSHVVPGVFPFDIETSTTPGVPSAKTKDQKLTEDYCYIDRERDFALIHLASSPAGIDFARFFPEEYPQFRTRATTLLWKSPDNRVISSTQPAREMVEDLNYYGYLESEGLLYGTRNVLNRYTLKKGTGLKVDLDFQGFGGLCGGMYIDASKGIIYGFHVAGYAASRTGYLTCITKPMLDEGLAKIRSTSPTLVVHNAQEVRVDTYGLPYTLVNEKPLYLREDGTQQDTIVTYFGKVLKDGLPMESRARAPYVKTPFQGVPENLGENKHRPPRDPNDVGKGMKTLSKLTDPVQHYEGDLLKRAIDDYKNHTLKIIHENLSEVQDMLRIYTQEEAMDGIGEFGLGGLPNDTSAGFPINKSKKQCLVRDPMDEALVKVPREFNDTFDIQSEIDRTEKAWREGSRSETIYKASSKVNELLPHKKALEKVRKFYGSSFANFVASRKVLAGIPRFMRRFWAQTECLVGINPTSKEWDEFHTYLTRFSTTRMIAGDFSGFDTRMAAQITSGAAAIMVSWYQLAGCTEDELQLLRGALSDIIHPNILFDGDLYRFANGNPSGNLITVQLNSICNSLMMRYVYYSMMPSIREPFAENVSLGTYGDDNAMSVRHCCRWYNHTSCQAEFEKLDIGYTMATKDAMSVPYIPISEITFLKRNFVRHADLGKIVAPIEWDSILKKFFWVKKPTESPLSFEEQFGAYTDGSFREAYLHGREAYDDFVMKIRNIVDLNPQLKAQISFIPYDEMTQILRVYYQEDYVNDNTKLFAESCGVCIDEL